MSKKSSPLDIMNMMGQAAQKKAQPQEPDADDMPLKPKKKQAAAINEKKKGNAPLPKVPKSS